MLGRWASTSATCGRLRLNQERQHKTLWALRCSLLSVFLFLSLARFLLAIMIPSRKGALLKFSCIVQFEKLDRPKSLWFGGVDCHQTHHVFFEGIYLSTSLSGIQHFLGQLNGPYSTMSVYIHTSTTTLQYSSSSRVSRYATLSHSLMRPETCVGGARTTAALGRVAHVEAAAGRD